MNRPTRASVEGRVYLDLQYLARRTGRPNAELQQLYVLEGFLARLSTSEFRDRFVLKGGVLLAAFESRRPTRDLDFQATAMPNDIDELIQVVQWIARVEIADGLVFDADSAEGHSIRDEDDYQGVRVSMAASLAKAKLAFHVDVNFGDPIWPAPANVELPRILGGNPIELRGYPIHMVLAEKLVTSVDRGVANTRWRDFGDMWVLSGRHRVDGAHLMRALGEVARYRSVELRPWLIVLDGYGGIGQTRWKAWRRKQQLEAIPEEFGQVLDDLRDFAEPALLGQVAAKIWDPEQSRWVLGEERRSR